MKELMMKLERLIAVRQRLDADDISNDHAEEEEKLRNALRREIVGEVMPLVEALVRAELVDVQIAARHKDILAPGYTRMEFTADSVQDEESWFCLRCEMPPTAVWTPQDEEV